MAKTNSHQEYQTKALQITTEKVQIKADDNTSYVLIAGAVIVSCFFLYLKFGHKHVSRRFSRKK